MRGPAQPGREGENVNYDAMAQRLLSVERRRGKAEFWRLLNLVYETCGKRVWADLAEAVSRETQRERERRVMA